ncbi:MAG TPA: tRNA dihydrouridine synthase DusB [Bacilli bacterium]|mgnify:CR=1 FL=1|nr:tRNA dihydrouridine synthase DusB [Bacilli bacterium]
MKFKIGNVVVKNQVILAPMAGLCNSAFRKLVKEMGCGLVYAEMISDKALVYNNKKTEGMLYFEEEERPIVQQIFGSDIDSFVKAAKIVEEKMNPDIIDINMGCPVPKVAVRSQAGAGLLKDPNKVYEIVKSVVSAVPCPVTVKIRSGWDEKSINAVTIAKLCEKAGAKAICIHPRTRNQGYTGKANWDIIKEIKENINIPVIGNGDIKTIYDAKRMLDSTKCDAIMIGRAAQNNPYIIKQIIEYIDNNNIIPDLLAKDKIKLCLKHLEYLKAIKEEKLVVLEMRTHISHYLKGLKEANDVKQNVFNAKSVIELEKILLDYYEKLEKNIL